MENWCSVFSRYDTTCLLGPSNVGKTSLFLKLDAMGVKKILLTVLEKEFIVPLNSNIQALDDLVYINLRQMDAEPPSSSEHQCIVLVDEIHMFTDEELIKMALTIGILRPLHVYFTALTGSYQHNAFKNSVAVVAHSNIVLSLTGTCHKCGSQTSRSGKLGSTDDDTEVIVGKSNFAPECYSCGSC